jgi:glutathione S-transferase
MKLYVTRTSPYARLARIVVLEKQLEDRIEIIDARTRTPDSPYYRINPSGRVPYLIDDAGVGTEDSQLICAYLDGLDGNPRLHRADLEYRRLEARARSMCDGISVWVREMRRPESERSPTILNHEVARSHRMADYFEAQATSSLLQGPPLMAHFVLLVGIDIAHRDGLRDLTQGRAQLADLMRRLADRPSVRGTAYPPP